MERVHRHIPVLLGADGMPIAEVDLAVVAAARDAGRSALLLAAIDSVREGVVGADVIELRGGLIVPRAPGLAAVDRDHRPLIAGEENYVGIVRVDPEPVIVVAA